LSFFHHLLTNKNIFIAISQVIAFSGHTSFCYSDELKLETPFEGYKTGEDAVNK